MKLNTETREVTRSGPFRETGFRIAANAKAFDILSSKLYTNTRLAIVRELSTNAFDAQVDAGNRDRPFDVHLPNSMEPYFSIRDYGTGMSQETVESVYTTYFESTRNSSNDFVGALGLGSKSPFSYTDQFVIKSFYNGTLQTYSAFKGESGEPSIALLSSDPTTEENGVEIRINIDCYDFSEFTKSARSVYQFFSPRPNITGVRIDFPEMKPVFEGANYKLYSSSDIDVYSRISVVMGNVRYDAPSNTFSNVEYYGRLVIYMNIGDCSVAASREQLHDDTMTRANIVKCIAGIEDDINAKLKVSVENETCLMYKLFALSKYSNVFKYNPNLITIKNSIQSTVDGVYSLRKGFIHNDRMTLSDNHFTNQLNISNSESVAFVHDDLIVEWKQKDKNKLRHWLINNNHKEVYLAKITDAAAFKEIFGDVKIAMSKLPDVPRAVRGPRNVSSTNKLFIKSLDLKGWRNVETLEMNKSCVVARDGNKIKFNNELYSCDGNKILQIAVNLGFTTVYGIASGRLDKINEELDLPLLEDHAKEYIEKYVNGLDKYTISRTMYGDQRQDFSTDNLKKMKELSSVCADIHALTNVNSVSAHDSFLMTAFGLAFPKAENFQEKFKQRYPLLANCNLYYANINDVIEYITLKEKQYVS